MTSNNIQECLDKGVANDSWGQFFPYYSVSHLSHMFSDHCPVVMDIGYDFGQNRMWQFHFEAPWFLEESCEDEVARFWGDSKVHVF